MDLAPPIQQAPVVRLKFNVGAGFDVMSGSYLEGRYGQQVLNGGHAVVTGITGKGNTFKSTLMRFLSFTAYVRATSAVKHTKLASRGNTYDTEMNSEEVHLSDIMYRIELQSTLWGMLPTESSVQTNHWTVTDGTVYTGNKWYDVHKPYMEMKVKNAEKIEVTTPFWNRTHTGPFTIPMPTFQDIDSFTRFETDNVIEMQDSAELGDQAHLMVHQKQGLAKKILLMEIPRLASASYVYTTMVAHLGKESAIQKGPAQHGGPETSLSGLKNGDKLMGVTKDFSFAMLNLWQSVNAKPLLDGNLAPEYPRDASDRRRLDADLVEIQVKNLRGKSGPSNMPFVILSSQSEGVLPFLTEFHHIRQEGYFGMDASGNKANFSLHLYPGVNLQRTTVRGKLDADAKLRRAVTITSELCQMSYLWHGYDEDVIVAPKVLYDDLIALGYDWDILLQTRGWWTVNDEDHPVPYLSTMDLLNMRLKKYVPYWYPDDLVPEAVKDVPRIKPEKPVHAPEWYDLVMRKKETAKEAK